VPLPLPSSRLNSKPCSPFDETLPSLRSQGSRFVGWWILAYRAIRRVSLFAAAAMLFAGGIASPKAYAQAGQWTWMGGSSTAYFQPGVYGTLGVASATNIPGSRHYPASWVDANGNLWLFGGYGVDSTNTQGDLNDLWEYSPTTGLWTWMGGSSTVGTAGGGPSGVYGTLGVAAASNIPGGRERAGAWTDSNGNFWLLGGVGIDSTGAEGVLGDLWKFNPSTRWWTWMAGSNVVNQLPVYGTLGVPDPGNTPGGRAENNIWKDQDGNVWLFSGGANGGAFGNDVWKLNLTTLEWTWEAGASSVPFLQGGIFGVYGTLGVPSSTSTPGGRIFGSTWIDASGNFWLFGGYGCDSNHIDVNLNDMWEFSPATKEWTWMGGSSAVGCSNCNAPGIYGTLGVPSSDAVPGGRGSSVAWTDSTGNFWLFGGRGADGLNDLWSYNPLTRQWVWVGGNSNVDALGIYGSLGVPAAGNLPGARYGEGFWKPAAGNIWIFGGDGINTVWEPGDFELNDLWTYTLPPPITWPTAPPSISPGSATYAAAQTVTISDVTPGALIYYTTDGTTPTTGSAQYTSSISVSSAETIQAIAIAPAFAASTITSASYAFQTAVPNFNPPPAAYSTGQSVTISDDTPGATIYYTTDGTTPTTNSAKYSGPIAVSQTTSIRAMAVFNGFAASWSAKAVYTIGPVTTPAWAWISGSNSAEEATVPVYGSLGIPSFDSVPGGRFAPVTWIDNSGNLWLFGGQGYASWPFSSSFYTYLNDLWKFNPSTRQWTWMAGSSGPGDTVYGPSGVYGTKGVAAPGNAPASRINGSGWIDQSGNLWLFGGLSVDSHAIDGYRNDLWEFSPTTGEWTWVSGSDSINGSGASGVYGNLGVPSANNHPGAREGASSWTDFDGNLWLFGGASGLAVRLNDLWKFNPSSRQWAWMGGNNTVGPGGGQAGVYGVQQTTANGNAPGGRAYAVSWTDSRGDLWLFGGQGFDSASNFGYLNDLWEFDPSTNEWTWMSGTDTLTNFSPYVYGVVGVYGSLNTPDPGNVPGGRLNATGWTDIYGNLWLFSGTGYDGSGRFGEPNDFWEFDVELREWIWRGGSNVTDPVGGQIGIYGTLGVPSVNNFPGSRINTGSWVDAAGDLWLFGGAGFDAYVNGSYSNGYLNDLWEYVAAPILPAAEPIFSLSGGTYYAPLTVAISDATFGATIYYTTNGTLPTTSSKVYTNPIVVNSSETISAIAAASGVSNSAVASASYTITVASLPATATPAFSLSPGAFNTAQTVSISDSTPSSQIFFTTDGTTPTTASSQYLGPILVDFSQTINAIAVAPGFRSSAVATAAYTLVPAGPGEWAWMSGTSTMMYMANAKFLSSTTPEVFYSATGTYNKLGTSNPANMPGGRDFASQWTDSAGNLWLFGGLGFDQAGAYGYLNDLWKFVPSTHQWTWMGGSSTLPQNSGTSSQPGVYGTRGVPDKGNIPGGRSSAERWIDNNGNFWMFGGLSFDSTISGSGFFNDLWRFDPSAQLWTWMGGPNTVNQPGVYGTMGTPAPGNVPPGRSDAVAVADKNGNLWLFGGQDNDYWLDDLWEFNQSTGQWTWMGGSSTPPCYGQIESPVYGTLGVPAAGNSPGCRYGSVGWSDASGNLWIFGGIGPGYNTLDDLWEFNASLRQWAWMGGLNVSCTNNVCLHGVYGTLGSPAAANLPGGRYSASGWTDKQGNLWLFGGKGYSGGSTTDVFLNDLWKFDPSTGQWAWMSGANAIYSSTGGQPGIYGALGSTAVGNVPGGRLGASSWVDARGNLWLFGGWGFDSLGILGDLNDLWEYKFATSPASQPTFNLTLESNTQTVTISDATPGAAIYYTTDGTTPTTASALYTGPLTFHTAETLKAVALANGYQPSSVAAISTPQPNVYVTPTRPTRGPRPGATSSSSVNVQHLAATSSKSLSVRRDSAPNHVPDTQATKVPTVWIAGNANDSGVSGDTRISVSLTVDPGKTPHLLSCYTTNPSANCSVDPGYIEAADAIRRLEVTIQVDRDCPQDRTYLYLIDRSGAAAKRIRLQWRAHQNLRLSTEHSSSEKTKSSN